MPSSTAPGRGFAAVRAAPAPYRCAVTHQIPRNHSVCGLRESWKTVPAVTDAWQRRQTKPSEHRN